MEDSNAAVSNQAVSVVEHMDNITKTDLPIKEKAKLVPIHRMFRFAKPFDYFLVFLGTLGGMANGASMSGFVVIFGNVLDTLNSPNPGDAAYISVYFVYLGIGVWVAATFQVACYTAAAERMTIRMRESYLNAILAQDMAFFDVEGTGSLTTKISENSLLFREAMGEKFASLFQFGSMFLGGFIVGFIYVWQLCLVILAMSPLLGLTGYIMANTMSKAVTGQLAAYAKAGNVAEESLRLIRTVTAFGMQISRVVKYEKELQVAAKRSTKQGLSTGVGMGSVMFLYFVSYSIAFWVGAVLIVNSKNDAVARYPMIVPPVEPYCVVGGEAPLLCASNEAGVFFETEADVCACAFCRCGCYPSNPGEDILTTSECITGGDIVLTFFSVLIGSFAIGQAAPSITAVTSGRAAAYMLYEVIDRKPAIDANSKEGIILTQCKGELKFNNVMFKYPTRDQMILRGLSLTIPAGQRVALVGESGSGKSTVIALLERYYDPTSGTITLDGISYTDINLSSLRKLIGLVSQEPVLFATTVMENVRYGRLDATDEEVIEACKQANAHGFITEFSEVDPYKTFVNSSLVSGGQKQRLAIARALLRNPPILLLDEATAALDNESERLVNEAIDKLLKTSRTTIVIAHRLSSIQTCDYIFVMDHGLLVEEGAPSTLALKENGHYAALVKLAQGGSIGHVVEPPKEAAGTGNKINSKEPSVVKAITSDEPETENSTTLPLLEEEQFTIRKFPLRYALKYSQPDWLYFLPAIFAASCHGLSFPVFALLFSNILNTFYAVNSSELLSESVKWCLAFFGLALGTGIAVFFQNFVFGYINGRSTMRARMESFKHILSMEVGFFDIKENNVGALTSKLATDCGTLKSAISDRMEVGAMNSATIISGLIIAFLGSWQVALVTFALFPMMVIAGIIQFAVMSGVAGSDQKSLAQAAHTLTEAIGGIRTVAAFDMQSPIASLYMKQLAGPLAKAIQKGVVGGLGFGFSQGVMFFGYALAFWYGSTLVSQGEITFGGLNQALFGILMTAMALGQAIALFPDIGKGQAAVNSIFTTLSRPSKINPFDETGLRPSVVLGDVEFQNVSFVYPSRPNIPVLKSFNLNIARGSTVAFVGTSGSGKSTLVLLLERFYDPLGEGSCVKLDGVDVRELNVDWLRRQIGIVSQEPNLFAGTISENIRNGKVDASEEEVIEAAKMANCYNFIMGFPEGFNTSVIGTSLSGGQKQRVCIARALLRKPKLLLLDEATSALDEESQKVVQDALDHLLEQENRTTIVVAHRLSTIRAANVIVVLQHGVVVEQGSYEELMQIENGAFQSLQRAQQQQEA